MMKNLLKGMLCSSALALAFSVSASAMDGDVDAEVRAFYETATNDFTSCNVDTIGAYSAEGHTGFYPDSLDLHDETSDEARQESIAFCEGGGSHELTYEIINVIPLKKAAVAVGTGHYKRTEPGGMVTIDTDYSFTDVLVKTDDGWKFRHSHIGVAIPMEDAVEE